MSRLVRPEGVPRCEIWDRLVSDGGKRLSVVTDPLACLAVVSLYDPESLTLDIPRDSLAINFVRENGVATIWRDDDDFDEWIIGPFTNRRDAGSRISLTAQPPLYKLGTCGLVTEYQTVSSTQRPQLDVGVTQLSLAEIIQTYIIEHPEISAELPWLTLGDIDFDTLIDLEWSSATPLQILRAGVAAIQATLKPGDLCELAPLRRIGTSSYAIDVVAGIGITRPRVSLALRRNLTSLEEKNDPTDRATRIVPVTAEIGDQPTLVGEARWIASDTDSGEKTLVANDPAGDAGPIGFDDQLVNWYLTVERTGLSVKVVASDADTQTLTLASWPAGLSDGDYFGFRTTAPTSDPEADARPYMFRLSTLPGSYATADQTPVYDAEVTALVGSTITVRDGWLSSGVPPVNVTGQHVGRLARLSTLIVATSITSFVRDISGLPRVYTYGVADVSALQVGDWIRRAASASSPYGDVNTVVPGATSVAMTITSIDGGANTFTVVMRDGSDRIIDDHAGFGYDRVRIYRPLAGLRAVTASDGTAHTLTVDDVSGFSVGSGPGAVELFVPPSTTGGEIPYYLDHPVYVQPGFPGIGVKLRTVDRSGFLSIANRVPNAIFNQWADHGALPDGYVFSGLYSGVSTALTGYASIAYNNDKLFTKNTQSLFFSLEFGQFISPPFPFTPERPNQRASVLFRLYLTSGWGAAQPGAQLWGALGIKLASGVVKQWNAGDEMALLQPTSFRPTNIWSPIAENAWDEIALQGVDITVPSMNTNDPNHVTQADIDALSDDAQGLVFILGGQADNSHGAAPIEGHWDGGMLTLTDEAAPFILEFGEANLVWQSVNLALGDLAPPQKVYTVGLLDLFRLNTTLTEEEVALGGLALVNGREMGIVNVERRFSEVRKNHLVPGDTQVVLAKKRRFTDLIAPPRGSKGAGPIGGTPPGPPPTTPPGGPGTSIPVISLAAALNAGTLVPSAIATVISGTVIRVKFAMLTNRTPTADEVRAMSSVTIQPFEQAFAAIDPLNTAYMAALPYSADGIEGALATAQITAPAFEVGNAIAVFLPGVGMFADDAKTTAADPGDFVHVWEDQTGNGWDLTGEVFGDAHRRPERVVDAIHFGDGETGHGVAMQFDNDAIASVAGLELWMRFKFDADPPALDMALGSLESSAVIGASDTIFKSNGHIEEGSFLDEAAYDAGNSSDPLDVWWTYRRRVTTTELTTWINETILDTRAPSADPNFTGAAGWWFGVDNGGGSRLFALCDLIAMFDGPVTGAAETAWRNYFSGVTSTPPLPGFVDATTPVLTFTRSGGDVIVTATAGGADSVKIAGDLAGVPSDSDVRAATAITVRPFQVTFAAPAVGETLHVAAFGYVGVDESTPKSTLNIPYSAGGGGGGSPTGAEYLVGAADPSLPNARVVTDSATATWDLSVPGEAKVDVVASVAALDDVGDVDAPTPSDGDVLTFVSGSGNWEAAAPTGGTPALDDLSDVTVPTPSDGDLLAFDSGSGDWVNVAPGAVSGGNGRWDPMALRAGQSASALDDDWSNTGTTLTGIWTAGATWPPTAFDIDTTKPGKLYITAAGNHQEQRAIFQAIPAGDFVIQSEVTVNPNNANISYAGLIVTDGVGGSANVVIAANHQAGASSVVVYVGTAASIGGTFVGVYPAALNPVVIRIERISGSYFAEFSPDGILGQRFSFTPGVTLTHFGVSGVPYTNVLQCTFGAFRYSATATTRWGKYL